MHNEFCQRTTVLIGESGLQVLRSARVAVFGVGGVGSFAAEALARAGIGAVTLVDFDVIKPSNLNRQLPATTETIGQVKVEAMARRLQLVNPEITVDIFPLRFTAANADELLDPSIDFVIDAIDSLSAKVNLIHACLSRRIRIVASMGSASKIRSELVRVGDLFESRCCPLAKMVRKRLRRRGVTGGVPVVFSEELPILSGRSAGAEYDDESGDAEGEGVHGTISYMPALFGVHCAGYVIQQLLSGLHFVRRGDTPGIEGTA